MNSFVSNSSAESVKDAMFCSMLSRISLKIFGAAENFCLKLVTYAAFESEISKG